jgi:hypothetical protein
MYIVSISSDDMSSSCPLTAKVMKDDQERARR